LRLHGMRGEHRRMLDRAARLADRIRFVFVPVALCALAAVGVHAAADVLGDRILWLADAADAAWDSFWSRWSFTAPLVSWIGPAQRIAFARAVALVWELVADAVLAVPLLAYDERADEVKRFRELAARAAKVPTLLRVVRPVATAAVALAGASAAARLLEGTVRLSLHAPSFFARGLAVVAVCALVASLAWRAVVHALARADATATGQPRLSGIASSIVVLPLAAAALRVGALLSFWR
jgi:hypothetical protein